SLQPPSVTRYLPRVICESSAAAVNAGSAIAAAVTNARRSEIRDMIGLPGFDWLASPLGKSLSAYFAGPWSRLFSEFELRCAYSTQLCASRFAADHGAVRGGRVEPDRLDVPKAGVIEPRRIF